MNITKLHKGLFFGDLKNKSDFIVKYYTNN